jgi:DDE superfamily endonuclease
MGSDQKDTSVSLRFIGYLSRLLNLDKAPRQGNRPMELTASFVDLLHQFSPVFTAPTSQTFLAIVAGWVLSQRHRFITEVIFSSGHVGNGHWSRFHRFFSHAAWDIDTFSLFLVKLVVTILAPGALLIFSVDDSLCRKRGLTLYGAGMHYDPLISSRSKALVSWGHDWVVLCIIVVHPFWAPTKVFALPIAARLYINRQGLTKGKKSKGKSAKPKADPNHRTRPELALELIQFVARWFPDDEIIMLGDSAYGGRSVLSHLPPNVHLISRVHPKAALYQPAAPKAPKTKGAPRKKGDRLPGMAEWAADPKQPWTRLDFDQFGLHAALEVKTKEALYYKSGRDRLLNIVLVRDLEGKRLDQMFYCTKREWTAREILSAYACRWAIECTFEYCKQFLGLEDPANRLPKAVERTAPMAMFMYSLVVVWFHRTGHQSVRFPFRPWYPKKAEASFADMLTTLRRLSYDEKTEGLLANPIPLKTWLAQLTELLSRTG